MANLYFGGSIVKSPHDCFAIYCDWHGRKAVVYQTSAAGMSSPGGETRAVWETARGICPAKAGRRSPSDRASGRERVHTGEGELNEFSLNSNVSQIHQASANAKDLCHRDGVRFSPGNPHRLCGEVEREKPLLPPAQWRKA